MSPWERLLEKPQLQSHFVQLYCNEAELANSAGHYLFHGLRRGSGVLVIATLEHEKLLCGHLNRSGANVPALLENRQLIFRDAQSLLNQLMVSGLPDWQRFENAIRAAMRQVQPAENGEGLRAYGEMVGILWNAGQFGAAVRLEQLWNRLLEQSAFSLYCSYPIGVFDEHFEAGPLEAVLCAHTHLLPAQPAGPLETALKRSMDEILGPESNALWGVVKATCSSAYAVMPAAEATVLWLRKNMPEKAERIMRQARRHYRMLLEPAVSPLMGE
jgi:hypothetical protein